MRLKSLASFVVLALLTSCANHGTIVEKRSRVSPFNYSAGIDGVFSFLLRDEQGKIHSQMVTPEVFEQYQVGDQFDDQKPAPAERSGFTKDNSAVEDSKTVKPVVHPRQSSAATRKHRLARHHAKHHSHAHLAKHPADPTPKPATEMSASAPSPAADGLSVTP